MCKNHTDFVSFDNVGGASLDGLLHGEVRWISSKGIPTCLAMRFMAHSNPFQSSSAFPIKRTISERKGEASTGSGDMVRE